jgi:hypothetical protein
VELPVFCGRWEFVLCVMLCLVFNENPFKNKKIKAQNSTPADYLEVLQIKILLQFLPISTEEL